MRLFKRPRAKTAVILIGAGMLTLAACTSSTPTPTPTATPSPTASPTPSPTPTAIPVVGSGISGGDPDFDFSTLIWQGYWLSRDQFGPLVMASGMGIPFEPPMETMQMAMGMVAQNPDDPIMLPQNMMPLQALYASASPSLLNDPREFDPMDFESLRLDSSSFTEEVSVRGQAATMLKESQWAHNFASTHFGEPTGDFGAQQRFMGMMVSMLAQMQGQYAMQNLMGVDGLYHDSDGAVDYVGNWVMLHALSDIAGLTGDAEGRYMNPDAHPMFDGAATQLFQALEDRQPETAREAAAAIRALQYRASTTSDDSIRTATLAKATAIADTTLVRIVPNDVVEGAAAITGLMSVAVAEDSDTYLHAAVTQFQALTADFDATNGVFTSKSVYSADDVAWIIGGLNFLAQRAGGETHQPASNMLLAFYESTISLAGMQLSAPPGKSDAMASEWEMDLPSALFYHPANTPPPPMAGTLPVPAEEITWDGNSWSVTSDRLVTDGAMHLANDLNWLGPHLGSSPFPVVGG